MKTERKKNPAPGKLTRTLLVITMYLLWVPLSGQSCGGCTVTISGSDTLAYTVSSGEVFCIDSTGQFEGTLTLSGGTICNRGIFHPKMLSAGTGTIMNYSCLRLDSNVVLPAGVSLNNGGQSIATFLGDLTISGGSLINAGITDIEQDLVFSAGSFSNTAIVNCRALTGASAANVNNSGIINKN